MSNTSQGDEARLVTLSGCGDSAICLGLGTAFTMASLGAGASIPPGLTVGGSVVALLGWASLF